MKYTKKDLKEGMKLRVIDGAGFDFWEEGSVHEVIKRNGTLIIDYGDTLGRGIRNSDDILSYLNLEYPVKMEVVEEPSEKAALKALDNKIRELINHQLELFQKRDRINKQAIQLGSKARRLEEAKALIEKYI